MLKRLLALILLGDGLMTVFWGPGSCAGSGGWPCAGITRSSIGYSDGPTYFCGWALLPRRL